MLWHIWRVVELASTSLCDSVSELSRENDVKRSASVFPASLGGGGGKNFCCANSISGRETSSLRGGACLPAVSVPEFRCVMLLKKFSLVSCEDTRNLGWFGGFRSLWAGVMGAGGTLYQNGDGWSPVGACPKSSVWRCNERGGLNARCWD